MNRTRIEWTDYTWNPITGCLKRCSYCYAMKMARRLHGRYGYPETDPFQPFFHPDRLSEPLKLKKPSKIFTCSMGEPFGFTNWVPIEWIEQVFKTIWLAWQHTFQILTKQPQNIPEIESFLHFPYNLWLGVSITCQEEAEQLHHLKECNAKTKFVSFEPLLEEVIVDLNGLDWVIIGAQSNPDKQPRPEWVQHLITEARHHKTPIFLKDNLTDWKKTPSLRRPPNG